MIKNKNYTKPIRSRFDFQSAAERGLAQGDQYIQKLINMNDPDIGLSSIFQPNHANSQNLSVQLTKRLNSQSNSPAQQSKVLDDSQMTKLVQPLLESKRPSLQEDQINTRLSIQFQELSDENLGFYHSFLLEQSTEQNFEKKQILRQSTQQQNQLQTQNSLRKRQSSFQMNQNIKSDFEVTNQKEDFDENISYLLNKSNQSQNLKIGEDELNYNYNQQIIQITEKLQYKVNKFKYIFLLVRAIIRMIILIRPQKQKWVYSQKLFCQLQKKFKFKDKLIQNKIKLWTQITLTKVLSVLRFQNLQQWNFIDGNLEDFQKDLAITNFLNLCSHLISNLEITTQPNTFLPELGYQSYLEQFIEYRQTYNIFVSKRTNYLSNKYSKITPKEKAMIVTECVIMNNFIPNLIFLTQNKNIFNSDDENIQFLIRGFYNNSLTIVYYYIFRHSRNIKSGFLVLVLVDVNRQKQTWDGFGSNQN